MLGLRLFYIDEGVTDVERRSNDKKIINCEYVKEDWYASNGAIRTGHDWDPFTNVEWF